MSNQPKKKNESIFILIISLCTVAVVAAVVLSLVASITAGPIKKAKIETTVRTFAKLQPNFDNDPLTDKAVFKLVSGKWKIQKNLKKEPLAAPDIVKFYPAEKDGKLVSIFAQGTSPEGYGGNLTAVAAITKDGAIINVEVTQSQETAGLGTNVYSREITKTIWGIIKGEYKDTDTKLNPNPIMDFFNGKMYVPDNEYTAKDKSNPDILPEERWKVKKDGGEFKYITGATITSRTVTDAVKRMLQAYYQNKEQILKMFSKK
ncbi:MAG: RnfABCDGE type electron transport complex subunit G [Victivallales bacterium]|nr:RnfABCDGE type electron transport complex subunit G [Victivallales bacterium]